MIPRKIHYCWFGGKPIPAYIRKCMDSWSRVMPGVEIVRWDESNYDVGVLPYTRDAYQTKQWAFVSDYARLDVVFRYGGIYLDTDVELLRSLDPLLKDSAFCAREDGLRVATGLVVAAIPGNAMIGEMRDAYKTYEFPSPACTVLQTSLLEQHGLVPSSEIQQLEDLVIYPQEYFNPMDEHGIACPTAKSFAIHHAAASWMPLKWRIMKRLRRAAEKMLPEEMVARLVAIKRKTIGEFR